MSDEQALFVTGVEKSGKTPMRLLLDAQPWASIGRGRLWSRFYGRFGDLGDDQHMVACIDAIAEADPELDAVSLRHELDQAPQERRSYAGLLGMVARQRSGSTPSPATDLRSSSMVRASIPRRSM